MLFIFVLSACTPVQMLNYHRAKNPEGPYREDICKSPEETGTRWDCKPEKVRQLRREANWLKRKLQRIEDRNNLVWRWQLVANCESGGNWSINTGNGYYGGLQFRLSTWHSVGGRGYPHQNSPAEQAYRADILRKRAGLGQWPHCGRHYR